MVNMATQVLDILSARLPLIGTTILVSLVAFVIQRIFAHDPLAEIPWIGVELGDSEKRRKAFQNGGAKALYKRGYEKFKTGIFRLTSMRDASVVVVSPDFLPELKKLPDDVLSMKIAVMEDLESKYTGLKTDDDIVPHTIKVNLTPALIRLNPAIAEEVDRTLKAEFPSCKDWTPVKINSKLLRVVAIVSGRIFIGPELCHDEEYIDAAINYTVELMTARRAVQEISPVWMKRFRAPFLPEVKSLAEREKKVTRFLTPIVTARRDRERDDPGYKKPDDMLQWIVDAEKKFGVKEDAEIARLQCILSFAAIHTTTMTALNVFYNLAAYPNTVPEIREEVKTVLAEHDNQFTSHAMQSMKKLDSFLKETLRVHPPSFASFNRKVLKPIHLSNGTVIPAGVTLEVPAYGISRDPATFPNPDDFDGLRFYRMREANESFNSSSASAVEAAAHNQFVSVSQNSLTFGYGRMPVLDASSPPMRSR